MHILVCELKPVDLLYASRKREAYISFSTVLGWTAQSIGYHVDESVLQALEGLPDSLPAFKKVANMSSSI
jgi:hypothetical protein